MNSIKLVEDISTSPIIPPSVEWLTATEPAITLPSYGFLVTPRYPWQLPTSLRVGIGVSFSAPLEMQWVGAKPFERSSVQMGEYGIVLYTDPDETRLAKRVTLARLKTLHFTRQGRDERITAALSALDAPGPTFSLDDETWTWIAGEVDLEDL